MALAYHQYITVLIVAWGVCLNSSSKYNCAEALWHRDDWSDQKFKGHRISLDITPFTFTVGHQSLISSSFCGTLLLYW